MALPFMKFYPQDFITDPLVEMLSMSARGCYITLLCKLWMANEPYLPNDTVKLSRLVGVSHEEFLTYWAEIQQPGSEIFTIVDRGGGEMITQKRLLKEWGAVDEISETRRQAVSKRYTKSDTKPLQTTYKQDTNVPTNELQMEVQNENKQDTNEDRYIDTQILDTKILDLKELKTSDTILAPDGAVVESPAPVAQTCPHQKIIALYHEILPELPKVQEWTPARQSLLKNQWNKPDRRNLEFWRQYFEFVRRCPFLMGEVERSDGKGPFVASLEWLIRPKNMPKVLEGQYTDRSSRKGAGHTGGRLIDTRTPSEIIAERRRRYVEDAKSQIIDTDGKEA